MSERYSKLFTLPGNLYSTGSPVVIAAGSLLKDNQTGKVLVQLKIQNISEKAIKAAKVTISPLDTVGRLLGDCVEYQYLDLKTNRDDFFGQKTAIPLPDSATRSFSVSVAEVAFSDNNVWNATEEPWEMLSSPTRLEEKLGWNEAELLKQYHLDHGSNRQYWPTEVKDLWYCSCGVLNHRNESQCHACGKSLEDQLAVEIEALKAERDARLEREAEARERKAQEEKRQAEERAKREAEEKEENKKKQKALVKICSIAVAALIVIVAGIFVTTKVIIPNHNYNSAVALMESGDYDAAITAFKELDGYKDSGNLIDYSTALNYMESGKYSKAIKQFESLGDYSDAQEKIVECQNLEKEEYYRIALDYMDSGDYSKAIEKFEYLGDYSDAQEKLVECQNLKNEADYQAAIELMNSGEYQKAITKFKSLGDYSDAQEKIVECQNLLNENLSLVNVGDTITLGSYEQDNNTTNGAESIEWIVLEKNDNSIFVISKYALDAQAFNSERDYVTWETCTLRTWLNGTFYNNAFSTIEQGKIITHTYEATPNDYYGTSAGSDTQDKLCLLSNSEVLKYFGSSGQDAGCSATAYAISKGLGTYGSKKIVGWLLRTPGETQIGVSYASIHNDDGTLWIAGNDSEIGGLYVDVIGGIRPVMWISTEG